MHANIWGFRRAGHIYQLVIPGALKSEVLHDIHEGILGGHLGIDKCLDKLKERFYWPGQYNDGKNGVLLL